MKTLAERCAGRIFALALGDDIPTQIHEIIADEHARELEEIFAVAGWKPVDPFGWYAESATSRRVDIALPWREDALRVRVVQGSEGVFTAQVAQGCKRQSRLVANAILYAVHSYMPWMPAATAIERLEAEALIYWARNTPLPDFDEAAP
jgi:hypothetical protein